MPSKVVHFEIPADDVERAKSFYTDAFGWDISSWPDHDYMLVGTVATDERGMPREVGAINGGMLPRQEPIAAPIITIEVADIDAALAKIEELGGKVLRGKQPVAQIGFAAYFADTEGNTLGVWQSLMPA
jgi:predicted enzyme related to lactoylglutathione lyase